MKNLFLAKVRPETNKYRMYRLCLPENSSELLQQWGRIGDYIYEKWDRFKSYTEAKKQFEKLETMKRSEGYVTANPTVMPKNHFFYGPDEEIVEGDGQLSFLDDV